MYSSFCCIQLVMGSKSINKYIIRKHFFSVFRFHCVLLLHCGLQLITWTWTLIMYYKSQNIFYELKKILTIFIPILIHPWLRSISALLKIVKEIWYCAHCFLTRTVIFLYRYLPCIEVIQMTVTKTKSRYIFITFRSFWSIIYVDFYSSLYVLNHQMARILLQRQLNFNTCFKSEVHISRRINNCSKSLFDKYQ